MKILHYTLGLPPYQSGGLTKYATDLMVAQSAAGDKISLLYPGDYTFWKIPKTYIVKNQIYNGIDVYEIKNPSLVPLMHGVQNPSDIYEPKQTLTENALELFYTEVQPEVMHIHTFMGLPIELVIYLKGKGVKIIFTSHDYYGLCPKVNFINQDGLFCNTPGGTQCAICNNNAPGSIYLYLRNSKYVLKYKDLLSSSIKAVGSQPKLPKRYTPTKEKSEEYNFLLTNYQKLFELVDCFHFNSTVSKGVYDKYLTAKQSVVIPITHSGIKDFREIKEFDQNHIRLAFIGSTTSYKGFPLLKESLCELKKEGIDNWTLDVWGGSIGKDIDCNNIIYRGKYSPEVLTAVYEKMDLLIVPSICKETFSLIALEAISYGVPVLVSTNVGAKDIVNEYNSGFIFSPTKETLYSKLRVILDNTDFLNIYNKEICAQKFDHSIDSHILKIKQLYNNLF